MERHKHKFIIVSDNCICITNSYTFTKSLFNDAIWYLNDMYPEHNVVKNMSSFKIKMAWAVRDFLYILGIHRNRTKDLYLYSNESKFKQGVRTAVGCILYPLIH